MKPTTSIEIYNQVNENMDFDDNGYRHISKEETEYEKKLWLPADEVEKMIDENFSNIGHLCINPENKICQCTQCIMKRKMGLK